MKTVILSLEVTYDENKTDAESITTALDQVCKTAFTTPWIFSEYGSPTFGQFMLPSKWKIDGNKDLDLAIIEDTEEGLEVFEIGELTPENLRLAKNIVKKHNSSL